MESRDYVDFFRKLYKRDEQMGIMRGKTIIVTGGSSGIGFAIAKRFREEGANVIIASRDKASGEKAAKQIGAKFVQCNVTDEKAVAKLFSLNQLDILVNNAGIYDYGKIDGLGLDDWNSVLDVNLKGVFLCTKCAMPLLKKTHGALSTSLQHWELKQRLEAVRTAFQKLEWICSPELARSKEQNMACG